MIKIQKPMPKRSINKGSFSERLTIAVKLLGLSTEGAAKIVEAETSISARRFASHCRGERTPMLRDIDFHAQEYGRVLRVSKQWLLSGYAASGINQLTQNVTEPSSQGDGLRRMPILAPFENDKEIRPGIRNMSLPFPIDLEAGLNCSAWRVPEGDVSMMGEGYNLTPGTFVIVDPDQDIMPGQIVCCKPKGFSDWIVRILKSNLPYSKSKSFELVSPSPFFTPIKVRRADCTLRGRVRYIINQV